MFEFVCDATVEQRGAVFEAQAEPVMDTCHEDNAVREQGVSLWYSNC